MIFFFNFGTGSGYAAPIFFLLPVLLGNNPLSILAQLALNVFLPVRPTPLGVIGKATRPPALTPAFASQATPRNSQTTLRQNSQQQSLLVSWFLMLVGLGMIGYSLFQAANSARSDPQLWQRLQRLNPFSFHTVGAARPGGAPARQQPRQRANFDQVATILHNLPMEVYTSPQDLQQWSIHDLKHKLDALGIRCDACLEKSDLVEKLVQAGGSSGTTCSVCCEEYATDDVMRVLPCKHRFHLECVDRWFLSSTDYSRAPACPLCNELLIQQTQ